MYQITSECFSGPYGLLLQLIEENKLDITEVSLSLITEQFLGYLELNEVNSEELADFLVVASKLLLLKSKKILPELEEDDEEIVNLDIHLKLYKKFIDLSKIIENKLAENHIAVPRELPLKNLRKNFVPLVNFQTDDLRVYFVKMLQKLEPLMRLPQAFMERSVSIQEKILEIRKLFVLHQELQFKKVIANSQTRHDVIVSFLALLELLNKKQIQIIQEETFGEIIICRFN